MIGPRHCRALVAAASVAAILGAVSAPARTAELAMTPELEKVVAAAKKEGALTLSYSANILGGAEGARIAAKGIKETFGVTLDVTYYPGPSFAPMASRLYTEMQANQPSSTDVYNGTAVQVDPYLKRGLFRQVPWTALYPSRITPEIVEGDSRALRIVTKVPGILYNKKTASQFGKARVTADLLKPESKGTLYTTPYLAGFDVLVAKDVWGFDRTAEFVTSLSKIVGGIAACAATDRIASGEIPALAISCSGAEAHIAQYRDVIGEVVLRDAATRRFDYLCIPTHAVHPNAGILFALYASTPEGQSRILRDLFGEELDNYPDTQTHEEIAALEKDGVKFTDVTVTWWGSHPTIDADLGKLVKIITKQ